MQAQFQAGTDFKYIHLYFKIYYYVARGKRGCVNEQYVQAQSEKMEQLL